MRRPIVALAALLLLCSCQGSPTPDTPSGQLEMTYAKPAAEVKAAIVNFYLNQGYGIKEDSDFQIVFDKDAGRGASFAQTMLTCLYCTAPRLRPKFTFVALGGDTRVVASAIVLMNAKTIEEIEVPSTNPAVKSELLAALQSIPGGVAPAGMTVAAIVQPPPQKAHFPIDR